MMVGVMSAPQRGEMRWYRGDDPLRPHVDEGVLFLG